MTIYSLVGLIAGIAVVVNLVRWFIKKPEKPALAYLQDFIGVFFIFSGAVKAIDPLGTAYKMTDYFVEFGFPQMKDVAVEMAVFMIVLELVLGTALIIGYKKNITLTLLMLMVIFFTFLTGFTYLSGYDMSTWVFDERHMKVTDCGCFGDFLKLKPWVSFYKDICLSIIILILVLRRRYIQPLLGGTLSHIKMASVTLITFFFCLYNFVWDIPVVDFRPYAVGEHIPTNMEPAVKRELAMFYKYENSAGDVVEVLFPGKPEGEGWTRVKDSRRDSVINPGVDARIANFQLSDDDGNVVNDDVLYNEDYVFMVVAYNLPHTNPTAFTEILNPIATAAENDGYMFFVATASSSEEFRHEVQASYPFYGGDETFLKTIIRSNPGLLILKDGKVVAKWHYKHIPSYESIKATYLK